SSFTFSNTNVSFEHPVSNISPQLFVLTALGTHLSNVTFAQEGGAVDLASLVFDDVIFTSVTRSGVDPLREDVSFDFRQLAIVSPSADGTPPAPVPEAGSWLLVISGVLVLVGKRFLVA